MTNPWGKTEPEWRHDLSELEQGWGSREYFDRVLARSYPSAADDESFRNWFVNMMRYGASPGAALMVHRMAMDVDVRDVLPAVHVPTLILHGPTNRGHALYIAERVPNAKRVEIADGDQSVWLVSAVPDQTARFIAAAWGESEPERVLSTVLFTDLVGSTAKATELGDRRWAELLSSHHAVIRRQLDRFRGRELDTAGDGFFASFDGPARAIRCAQAINQSVRELGLEIRAGLHTGECEIVGDKIGGVAVHIGARIAAQAGPGEILVSSTVKDLVAGSGIGFKERGTADFKGLAGAWQPYALDHG